MTLDVYNPRILKEKPAEVKESLYVELDDTSFSASGKSNSYDLYKFDSGGNVVFLKMVIENFSSEIITDYTEKGPQSTSKAYMTINSAKPEIERKVVFERIGAGKFKGTHSKNGVYEYHEMVTFLNNGLMVRHDRMNHDTLVWTVTKFFENGFATREEGGFAKEKFTYRYYYSEGGFIDSVVTIRNGLTSKKIFTRNEQGDVVKYEETGDGQRAAIRRMKYEYDEKGNWIKQICHEENGVSGGLFPGQRFSGYSIIVREIKY